MTMLSFLYSLSNGHLSETQLSTTVTNLSRFKSTITSYGFSRSRRQRSDKKGKFAQIFPDPLTTFPKTLDYMEYVTILAPASPGLMEKIRNSRRFYVVDSAGKFWYVSRRAMTRLREEIRGHLTRQMEAQETPSQGK